LQKQNENGGVAAGVGSTRERPAYDKHAQNLFEHINMVSFRNFARHQISHVFYYIIFCRFSLNILMFVYVFDE